MSRISPVNRNLSGYYRMNRNADNKDGLTANLSYIYPALRAPLLQKEGEFFGCSTQGAANTKSDGVHVVIGFLWSTTLSLPKQFVRGDHEASVQPGGFGAQATIAQLHIYIASLAG